MHVEDSYEGAVRRLRRLGHAGFDAAPRDDDRMRDLEELATLACDDNERLGRELDDARHEIDRLRRMVTMLQETIASAQSEETFGTPKASGRGFAFYFFTLAILGAAGVGLYTFRPWERARFGVATAAATAPAIVPAAPVVAAPPPVVTAPPPVVTAPRPVVTPAPAIVPRVAATIPKVAPVPAAPAHKTRAQRRHAAKHHSRHAAAKHAAPASKPGVADTSDPLGGVNL